MGPQKWHLGPTHPPWPNSLKCVKKAWFGGSYRRRVLRVMVTTLITPSGAGFPNIFFKNEFLLLQNRLKLKKIILTRRGGSNGVCAASLCSARWWDPRCAMFLGQNASFWQKITNTWRIWSAMRDDGLKPCQNGAILGRIVLDITGRHKKTVNNKFDCI